MEISDEQKRQRFLLEIEQAVRETNQTIIHERIPKLTQEHVLPLAATVARARARYLEAAFRVSEMETAGQFDSQSLKDLRQNRETYEETRIAFDALTRAIERGYVDIDSE